MSEIQVRRIDNFGRCVIPIDIRKQLDISITDDLGFVVEDDRIIISKISSSFNLEDFVRKFIVEYFGVEWEDAFVSDIQIKNIKIMLMNYVKKNILNI